MEQEQKPTRPVKVYQIDRSLKLTAKQAKFVYEYLIDYNGTQAAIRAGYAKGSAAVAAARLLTNDNVAKAIDEGKWFYQYQNGIDADWIRKQRIALFHKCSQAEPVMYFDKVDKEYKETGEYVFKDQTCRALLADMAKDIGMDAPTQLNVNQSGTVQHEHTVQEQMNFDGIKSKVDKHRGLKLVSNG